MGESQVSLHAGDWLGGQGSCNSWSRRRWAAWARGNSTRRWVKVEDLYPGGVAKVESSVERNIAQHLSHFFDSVLGEYTIQGAQELGDLLVNGSRIVGFLGSYH